MHTVWPTCFVPNARDFSILGGIERLLLDPVGFGVICVPNAQVLCLMLWNLNLGLSTVTMDLCVHNTTLQQRNF